MADIVDDSMRNMPNIDIKEEEEGDINLNEVGNKKRLYSSDDSKDQNDNQNIEIEPAVLNVDATNNNIEVSNILEHIYDTMDNKQKENINDDKNQKKQKNNQITSEVNQNETFPESSISKTTSDEDYQNPLEKGMVMEEYEDEDEFIGMEEEIPSHNVERKKNTRRQKGQRKKKMIESEDGDEENSSNSSSGLSQKKNQQNQKKSTTTRSRRKRGQGNTQNDSTYSEIKPQKRTRRKRQNLNESEIAFNNKEDNQLLKDAMRFINSKPRRTRTNLKKENEKINPDFLEKIQKKVKSNEKEAPNMHQINLNQINPQQQQQQQQSANLPQFIDLNKTVSNEIQFQQINPQLLQQQFQFQNLAQLQLQAMQQLPFILQQQQQQQQNQQQNGQLQAALQNPILLQNYQNQFLLQAHRNAEILMNVKKEDLSNQPLINNGLQQQILEENKNQAKQGTQPSQNSNNNQTDGRRRPGRRSRSNVQSNQANSKNGKEDESFTVDDLGRRRKYNTRRKTQKQNYAESPFNEDKEREEAKTQENKEQPDNNKQLRSLEEDSSNQDETNADLIEQIQRKAEERNLGKEIEQQLKDLLNKIENEKQNQILSQIVNKYQVNTEKIQEQSSSKKKSKGKDEINKKGTIKEIVLNPQQTLSQQLEVIDNVSVDSAKSININYKEPGTSDDNNNPNKNAQIDKEKEPKKQKPQQTTYKLLNYDKLEQKGNICIQGRKDNKKVAQPILTNVDQNSEIQQSDEDDEFIRDEVIPITGHFKYKDKAVGVLSSKILNKNIYLEIQWEKRKSGVTPTPTILNTHEVKAYDTDFLIDFYESKILKTNESKVQRQPQQPGISKNSHIEQLRQDVYKNQMQVSLQQKDKYFKQVEIKENQVLNLLDNPINKLNKDASNNILTNNPTNTSAQNQKKIDLEQNNESDDENFSQKDKNKIYQIDTPSSKSSEEFCIDPYRKFIEDEGLLPEQLQQELKEKLVF